MIFSINKIKYQRNGVTGEPFYAMLAMIGFDANDNPQPAIITMEYNEETRRWRQTTCRVTTFCDLNQEWAGSLFALEVALMIPVPSHDEGFIP